MTVTATIQSEWMSHIEGRPFPDTAHAHLLSTSRGPVVFFINKINGHLVVVKPAESGGQEVLDLSDLWELSDKVVCLATSQDLDGGLYLFFALQNKTHGLADTLYAIESISPQDFEDEKKWKSCLKVYQPKSVESDIVTVTSITTGSTGVFQRTAAVVYRVGSTYKALKLTLHLEYVKNKQSSWLDADSIDFAGDADASGVPNLIPGRFGQHSGIFFRFYCRSIQKFGFRQDDGLTRKLECPEDDITSLQVIYDLQHMGHLLVQTSKTLLMYDWAASTYQFSWTNRTLDSIGSRLLLNKASSNLKVASTPDSRKSSVWLQTGDKLDCLEYFETESLWHNQGSESHLEPVVLVRGEVATYSASITPNSSSRGVLWHRKTGLPNLIERSSTGLWSDSSFEIPAPSVIKTIPAYISHIKLSSDNAQALREAHFLLSATSSIPVLVNEEPYVIDEKPQLVSVDQHGKIEIVNLEKGIQTPQFILANSPDHSLLANPVQLDPAARVKERLRKNATPDQLRSLKVGDRDMFAKSTDFDQLSFVLQNMYKELDAMPEDGSRRPDIETLKDKKVESWSLFHVIETTLENVQEFVVEEGHLVIKMANDIVGFVLDCYETALKAINTVLSAAGAALEDLQHWLGFVFDWAAIASTHTSLAFVFNSAANAPDHVLENAFELVEKPLANLLERCSGGIKLRGDIKEASTNATSLKKEVSDLRTANFEPTSIMSHPAIDYILNKLSNLLSAESIKVEFDIGVGALDSLLDLFSTAKNIYDQFESTIKAISGGRHITLTHILESFGEAVISSLIETTQAMIAKFKKTVTKMIRAIPDIINKPRAIPLLSALYKYATGSKIDPSLLQITALMIAVPVAICCTVFEGVSFPTFADDLLTTLFQLSKPTTEAPSIGTLSGTVMPARPDMPSPLLLNNSTTQNPHLDAKMCKPETASGAEEVPPSRPSNGTGNALQEPAVQNSAKTMIMPADLPSLKALYQTAMPHLDGWRKRQANTLGWIDLVHTSITTLTIALPELPQLHILETDALDAGTITIDRLTVMNTIIEGFEILASLPMIHNDEWDHTPAVSLRFEAWAIDSVLKLLKIFTTWRAVHDEGAAAWVKSLTAVRNLVAVVMWSIIAEEELSASEKAPETRSASKTVDADGVKHEGAKADDAAKRASEKSQQNREISKRHTMAIWSMPEYMVLSASHMAPIAVTSATPPNIRAVLALSTFALGLAANASRWSRAEYHGDSQSTFSAGFA